MSYKRVFWGVLLILVGVLFILKNLGIVFFAWREFIHLWPLLFILWGLSVLPVKDYIKLILSLLVIALAFWLVQNPKYQPNWKFSAEKDWRWDLDEDNGNGYSHSYNEQEFSEPFDTSTSQATFRFDGGAGEFILSGTTDELVQISARGKANYSMTSQDSDDGRTIKVKMKDIGGSNQRNLMEVKLNPIPVWYIDIDCGAADLKADFSDFRIRELNLDAGAADIDITFGDLYEELLVKVDAGASDVNLRVPESSGCEIKVSSVLADHTFRGFEKIGRGHYRSEGFEEAGNKIRIDIDVAVADLKVERY